jgi:hypothetical protein
MDEMTRVVESVKSAHKRIDALETEVRDMRQLTVAVAQMGENIKDMRKDMSELKDDVKSLSARPGKFWDKIAFTAIGAAVTAIVGAIMYVILK